jgi:methyl-accepting chemotaxis protein
MVSSVQHSTEQAVAGIERGVSAVTESNQLADVTGETMAHLQQLSRQVANVVSEIDLALREQSTASAEVARRVEEIAAHASETSAATARAVHAAEMLDQEALSLQRDMQRFRL